MFSDQDDLQLAGNVKSWLRKKSTKRGLIIGGSIAAVAGIGYYVKNRKDAGNVLASKSLTQQQKGIIILAQAQQKRKGVNGKKGKSWWNKAVSWVKKSGVAQGAAEAMTKRIVRGDEPMPTGMANELIIEQQGGIGTGTAVAVGGAALVGAAVLAKGD